MKLKYQLLSIFVLIILASLSITTYITFKTTESAVIDNAVSDMSNDLDKTIQEIDLMHNKAKSDVVIAVNNPVFNDYFELPETRAGAKYDKDGVIQFTEKQLELKKEIDDWTLFIQSRFNVLETCVIDRTGQEYSRITNKEVAPTTDFSSEEEGASFFAPTLELNKNEVNLAYPYMSADALKWVFAYSTPIVLEDGSKPGFYHFEMPISIFQNVIKLDTAGRTFVLDPSGFLIADNTKTISIDLKQGADIEEEQKISEYMPSIETISTSPGFMTIIEDMKSGNEGFGKYEENGVTYYVAYKRLPTFGWSIATIKSYDELLEGKSSLVTLKKNIFIILLVSLLIVILIIFLVSGHITKSLNNLKKTADDITDGNLDAKLPEVKGNDEIAELTASIEMLIMAFKSAKQQNEPEKKVKK